MSDEENDILLEMNEGKGYFDIELTENGEDLKGAVNLRNAAGIMIFSERRTNSDDQVPNQAGYAGDSMDAVDEDILGSKLWQRLRGKSLQSHLPEAEEDVQEALQELITQGIASAINVTASYVGNANQRMRLDIEIVRLVGENVQFNYVWEQPLFGNGS